MEGLGLLSDVEGWTSDIGSKSHCTFFLILPPPDLSVCSSPGSQTIKLSSVMDVLPVMLYDTTTDMDVFINAVLVERGLARIDGMHAQTRLCSVCHCPVQHSSGLPVCWGVHRDDFLGRCNTCLATGLATPPLSSSALQNSQCPC